MPVWRCPHCATPQAEASRCWVCRRSTTSCVTCRYYRRAIAADLGLCGLEASHPVVAATDVQPCWVSAPASDPPVASGPVPLDWLTGQPGRRPASPGPRRTFVPVEALERAPVAVMAPAEDAGRGTSPEPSRDPAPSTTPEPVPAGVAAAAAPRPVPGRWWLWGDPDPWPDRFPER